jgi:hypothetical protein
MLPGQARLHLVHGGEGHLLIGIVSFILFPL